MLRVGYPATVLPELLSVLPAEVELVSISDKLDHEVEIDVWIRPLFNARYACLAAFARRKTRVGHDGGNGMDSRNGRSARDHLQCAWRAQHLHRRVDADGDSGIAQILPALSRYSEFGQVDSPL